MGRWMAAVLAGLLLIIYVAGPLRFLGNDTRPSVYAAVSLVKRGDLDLDEYAARIRRPATAWPYFVVPTVDGRVVSRFGPGVPVAAAPVVAVALFFLHGRLTVHAAGLAARFAAALYTAAAAALVMLAAVLLGATRPQALIVAGIYGLATPALSIASQGLFQHGPAEFFLLLGIVALLRRSAGGSFLAGLSFGAMVVCRPPDAPFALGALVWLLASAPRGQRLRLIGAFVATASILAAVQLAYNARYFGSPLAFSQTLRVTGPDAATLPQSYWSMNPLVGLAGLLLSPSRGLLIYSPVFVFLAIYWRKTWRGSHGLIRALLVAGGVQALILSRYYGWYGGWTFGYRMLADTAPILCLALVPVLPALSRRARVGFMVLATVSIVIQAAGAWNYSGADWDAHPDVDAHPERLWSIRDSQLAYVFTHRARMITW